MTRPRPIESYASLHQWMNRHYPRTGTCERCSSTTKRTHYASVAHRYTKNRADWLELCPTCHRRLDGTSAETRAKQSAGRKGKAPTRGTTGMKYSPETRAKMAEAQRVRHARDGVSAETREKIAAAKRGRKHSPETIAKMSAYRRARHEIS